MYLEHANGSSKLPGTDSITMLLSLTPRSFSFATAPLTRPSITISFHLACTIAMRSAEPSTWTLAGPIPLIEAIGKGPDINSVGTCLRPHLAMDGNLACKKYLSIFLL